MDFVTRVILFYRIVLVVTSNPSGSILELCVLVLNPRSLRLFRDMVLAIRNKLIADSKKLKDSNFSDIII